MKFAHSVCEKFTLYPVMGRLGEEQACNTPSTIDAVPNVPKIGARCARL